MSTINLLHLVIGGDRFDFRFLEVWVRGGVGFEGQFRVWGQVGESWLRRAKF